MELIVFVLTGIIWGYVSMKMAEKRGRDKELGFVSGFLFGIFAVIYYWIVGDTPNKI
jgi:hypothetical protein